MVTGGYSGVVIKNPVLVLPVLLCWWWMMMMTMRCCKDIQLWHALLRWWRTYSGLMPPWWWMKWRGLTMVAHLIHFLVGGGRGRVITSHISFMGHSVGPLSFPFGGSSRSTVVNLTRQQLGQLLGLHLKCSASLLGGAAIEKLAFEMEPNCCS